MKINNPFPYTDDNKRYHTYHYAMKKRYQSKVYKVCIDAGFTCPNRDGLCGEHGCNFCSQRGSGDMILNDSDIEKQIQASILLNQRKWPDAKKIAYFQSYSNTYAELCHLKKLYTPFFHDDRFTAIDIATRPDCLEQDKVAYFKEMTAYKDLTIELGLQSIHDKTSEWMGRGHSLSAMTECIQRCKQAAIPVCVHIMNGFPNETVDMMIDTARYCAEQNVEMIKIHMLHIIKDTALGREYEIAPFPMLSKEEYVDLIVSQLEILPATTIIARLTGDGLAEDLLAPQWIRRKVDVLNNIDKAMVQRNTMQGVYAKQQ